MLELQRHPWELMACVRNRHACSVCPRAQGRASGTSVPGSEVRYLVKPEMKFWGSSTEDGAHLGPRGRTRTVGRRSEAGGVPEAQGREWSAVPTATHNTRHVGSRIGVLSGQVAQGREDVVSESRTENSV